MGEAEEIWTPEMKQALQQSRENDRKAEQVEGARQLVTPEQIKDWRWESLKVRYLEPDEYLAKRINEAFEKWLERKQ